MRPPGFTTAAATAKHIDAYFNYIEGEYHLENKPGKEGKADASVTIKVWDREPEPATFAGLTLYLGFNSRQEFDDYEQNGAYAHLLKRAKLRIEASYERKLHNQSSTGAIFALKSMGWNERTDTISTAELLPKTIQIEIIETGPAPAATEKEVVL